MTRKDYAGIAAVIADSYPNYVDEASEPARKGKIAQYVTTATRLADHFEKENPRFDRKRFINACCGIV